MDHELLKALFKAYSPCNLDLLGGIGPSPETATGFEPSVVEDESDDGYGYV